MAVAVIGMAGYFPEANNIGEFYLNLKNGKDSVRNWSKERLMSTTVPTDQDYVVTAFLEEIDKFDYNFFNISLGEAQNMDPRQRLLLEVAYKAFENSGYNPDFFDGSNTAVFVGDTKMDYYHHAEQFDPTLITGNINSAAAGRISRFFNLRGMASMIDTACSSSLVAVHFAFNELMSGMSDYALVCGVNLSLFPVVNNPSTDIGISAPDGRAKAFSSEAEGTGRGELAACVLLKPYDKAVADHDNILAVIKGTAVNQDANLSGSFTAPSSKAQSEVILKAWKRANIDPETVTYIEAHGTGTKLGDPIEVQGIDAAFKEYTDEKQFCAISSVKTNIGHTDSAAGIAGLIKAILSLKNKELFPSLHFQKPNPFIDFENSAVYVNNSFTNWNSGKAGVRRAGISAFSLSGTNCHVVLEEASANPSNELNSTEKNTSFLFPISGKTPYSIEENIKKLNAYLIANPQLNLKDISQTLTEGRKHYSHRHTVIAKSVEELISLLSITDENSWKNTTDFKDKLVMIFSDHVVNPKALIDLLSKKYALFSSFYNECQEQLIKNERTTDFYTVAFQYSFYKFLEAVGIESKHLVGFGKGKIATSIISGKTSIKDGFKELLSNSLPTLSPDEIAQKADILIENFKEEKVAFIEIGTASTISEELTKRSADKSNFSALYLRDHEDGFLHLVQDLYLLNANINWNKFNTLTQGEKIELPDYQFEKRRCWIREINQVNNYHTSSETTDAVSVNTENTDTNSSSPKPEENTQGLINLIHNSDWSATENKLAQIWIEVLKTENLGLNDDFFELGGHSLNGVQIINRIKKEFGIEIEFEELFDFFTIKTLSNHIDELSGLNLKKEYQEILPVQLQDFYPVSHAQKRLWIMGQYEGDSSAYNISAAHVFEGELNINAFCKSFETLIERHESLRTVFHVVEGELKQKIYNANESGFKLEVRDLRGQEDAETIVQGIVYQEANKKLNLFTGPLVSAQLIIVEAHKYVFAFTMHHIIADGWSIEVFIKEVVILYNAYCTGRSNPLPALRIQYKDFTAWQSEKLKGDSLKTLQSFWKNQFAMNIPVLNMPTDYPRPQIKTFKGGRVNFALDKNLSSSLRQISAKNDCTLFVTLLTAYKTWLFIHSGQTDLIAGTPVAGRNHTDLENQIGLYLNTLAIRTSFEPTETFAGLLNKVKANMLKALEHQHYPFDHLIEDLNLKYDRSRNPLFDVGFTFNTVDSIKTLSNDSAQNEFDKVQIKGFDHGHRTVKVDKWLHVNESQEEIRFFLEYSKDLFMLKTIENRIETFKYILYKVTQEPTIPLPLHILADLALENQRNSARLKQTTSRKKSLELLKNVEAVSFDV